MESITQQTIEKSKSQIKREYLEIQNFVKTLLHISDKQLRQIPLSDQIRLEISSARKLSKSALKRQIGFIAKRMRDEDTIAAQQKLAELQKPHKEDVENFHQLENWRNQLINSPSADQERLSNQLVTEFNADRQHLRQLIREAKKELNTDISSKASRQLFRYLKQILK